MTNIPAPDLRHDRSCRFENSLGTYTDCPLRSARMVALPMPVLRAAFTPRPTLPADAGVSRKDPDRVPTVRDRLHSDMRNGPVSELLNPDCPLHPNTLNWC